MEIFLDTANMEDIVFFRDFIDGVTTNPSIMSKYKRSEHENIIKKICDTVSDSVSVEVTSESCEDMVREGRSLSCLSNKVCVKLPCTIDGLRACKILSSDGVSTNLTLCFSPAQAILAAKSGATYVSPFIGRLDDIGQDGMALIEEIREIYDANGYGTKILSASVRSLQHVVQSAMIGVDAITMSPAILRQCFDHPLTNMGLEIFSKDMEGK